MKVARNKMGKSINTQSGDALQRPRETCEGSRGPLSPPAKLIRIKQSECPQNLAHLLVLVTQLERLEHDPDPKLQTAVAEALELIRSHKRLPGFQIYSGGFF